MNANKIKQLFAAARTEPVGAVPEDFPSDVMRAVRNEPLRSTIPASIWDHLNALFPRVAIAAAAIIVLCLAADWGLTAAGRPGVSDGAAQATSQNLFAPEDL